MSIVICKKCGKLGTILSGHKRLKIAYIYGINILCKSCANELEKILFDFADSCKTDKELNAIIKKIEKALG